ncbi:MAG: ATP-binding protein [Chromatiales bacterium]|jgi:anti-sigma regulatory factor (Ser/Thr protein kinase)|nr:ATP-binding protein [Chromatiales bacterium]MDX9766235.1 ATP-binding protein [Ectothiorhodospiraceae bacterium]
MTERLEVIIANRLDEIPRLAEAIEAYCETANVSLKAIYNLNLALDELITNLVSYGYDDGGRHDIVVRVNVTDDRLTAEMIDDGKPFDPLQDAPNPPLDASLDERPIGGLGLYFVRTLMDDVRYSREDSRNRLVLTKRLKD